MATDFWKPYAVGGALRADSFSGMDPRFGSALQQMFSAAPPDIQQQLRVHSGYRSPQRQTELWNQALTKYGSPEAARKWVAPPGRSNHNHGYAADIKYLTPIARQWAHENAGRFGLAFPLNNENWHIELAGVRGKGQNRPQPQLAAGSNANSGAAGSLGGVPARTVETTPVAPTLQDMYANAQAATFTPPTVGDAMAGFLQTRAVQQQAQAERDAADMERRRALFSDLAAMYG
ncbi:M15 family metallopeptidase [Ochrobactrum sp. A-1]|uniref:M15 family metallopeptidase n=1 Tax=Ochrobactrum sp. A-1 TaxID=2920940 RepID=UPI001F0A94EE|nr:M15 family metallopeptidase [Ochrobactrum sp. A-1]